MEVSRNGCGKAKNNGGESKTHVDFSGVLLRVNSSKRTLLRVRGDAAIPLLY